MFLMSTAGLFLDFLEWLTSSLDIGSTTSSYTFGGLIILIAIIIALCSFLELAISIVSFVISKISKIPNSFTFNMSIVLYSINFVLMLIASVMSIICVAWHTLNDLLPDTNFILYAWAVSGILLWISMTILAVLNILRMKKTTSSNKAYVKKDSHH